MNGSSRKFFVYKPGERGGLAGCQHVAEGIVFSSNKVAVNWLGGWHPVTLYDNINAAAQDICRDGKAELVWAEAPA
jgi:hypothetical protein